MTRDNKVGGRVIFTIYLAQNDLKYEKKADDCF